MRRFISSLVVVTFVAATSPAFAQLGAVKEGAKTVGTAGKQVGEATVDTTKSAAKATAKETKKVASKTKDVTETTYRCADGTADRTTLKANACKEHGGVKAAAKR